MIRIHNPFKTRRRTALPAISVACLTTFGSAHAATFSWVNTLGGFYEDASSWVLPVVPPATNDVIFGVAGDYDVGFNGDHTAHDLLIANGVDLGFVPAGPTLGAKTYTLTGAVTLDRSELTLGGNGPNGRVNLDANGRLNMFGGRLSLLNGAQLSSQVSLANSNSIRGAGGVQGLVVVSGVDADGQPSRWQSGGGTNLGGSGGPAGLAILGGGQASTAGNLSIGADAVADGSFV